MTFYFMSITYKCQKNISNFGELFIVIHRGGGTYSHITGRQDSLSFSFYIKKYLKLITLAQTEALFCLFSYPGYGINIRSRSILEDVGLQDILL